MKKLVMSIFFVILIAFVGNAHVYSKGHMSTADYKEWQILEQTGYGGHYMRVKVSPGREKGIDWRLRPYLAESEGREDRKGIFGAAAKSIGQSCHIGRLHSKLGIIEIKIPGEVPDFTAYKQDIYILNKRVCLLIFFGPKAIHHSSMEHFDVVVLCGRPKVLGLRWYHNGKANCWKYINDMPIRISEANLGNFIKLYSTPEKIEETGY